MAQRIAAIASDRRVDATAQRARPAADERKVLPLERALPHERLKPRVCLLGLRDDEQPRRVAVEAVNDPAALLLAAGGDADESMHERPRVVTGSRVDDEAGGLVDHDEVLVLVSDGKLQLFALRRLRLRRRLELHVLPTLQPPRLRPSDAVDDHAGFDHALCCRSRADVLRDERVEPRAGRVVRNANAQDGPRRAARGAERPRRRR